MSYAESEYIISEIRNGLPSVMGAGIPPKNIDFELTSRDNKFFLRWTVTNTVLEGKTICVPAKVIFVFKAESAPTNTADGVVYEIGGAEFLEHSEEAYVVTGDFTAGTEYFCRAFTFSDQNVMNLEENVKSKAFSDKPPLEIYGFHQDFTNLDPDTSITWIKDCKDWTTPVHGNDDTGRVTLGDWANWYWLEQVKPYWLNKEGNVAYALNPNDYRQKLDGSPSDVGNPDAEGGAFVWIPKVYYKQICVTDNNNRVTSRDVYFANTNNDDETLDFVNLIFKDYDENEIQGFWFPMFYTNIVGVHENATSGITNMSTKNISGTWKLQKQNADLTSSDVKISNASDDVWRVCTDYDYNKNTGRFYYRSENGGGILSSAIKNSLSEFISGGNPNRLGYYNVSTQCFFRDILWMLAKTPDIKKSYGYGSKPSENLSISAMYNDTYVHGAFYGLGTDSSTAPKLVKLFHSIALGSMVRCVVDPASTFPNSAYTTGRAGANIFNIQQNIKFTGTLSDSATGSTPEYKYTNSLILLSDSVGICANVWMGMGVSSPTNITGLCTDIGYNSSTVSSSWYYYILLGYPRVVSNNSAALQENGSTMATIGCSHVNVSIAGYGVPTVLLCVAPPSPTYKPI